MAAKRVLKAVLIIIAAILVFAIAFVGYLTITEYTPDDFESLSLENGQAAAKTLSTDESFDVLTFNIGYAGLSETEDFFLDGGTKVQPDNAELVKENLVGIAEILSAYPADVLFIQEVDIEAKRTYGIDEFEYLTNGLGDYSAAFAANYDCKFVPIPIPFMGRVYSGVASYNSFYAADAERVSLPVPFSWPVRVANMKRCLLVERIPLEDGDNELVVINVHLDAHVDSEGRATQTQYLLDYVYAEYAKGNYVIAGGDFNQGFPGASEVYELIDESFWQANELDSIVLQTGWQFVSDNLTPTCRLLNEPYTTSAAPQYYVIDGFLVSPNLTVEKAETLDMGFKYSDHNPVYIKLAFN